MGKATVDTLCGGVNYSVKTFLLLFVFLFSINFISALSTSQWDYNPLDSPSGNYSINVNNTEHLQGRDTNQLYLYFKSLFDSVYLSLTNYNYSILTNDSMADTLHRHSELSASDGSPNPALQVDANGKIGIGMTGQTAQLHSNYSVPTSSRAWQLDYNTDSATTSPTGFRINVSGSNSPNNNYMLDGYYNNAQKFYIDVGGGLYLAGAISSAGLGVDTLSGITYAGNTNNLVSLRNPLEFVGTGYWSINNPRIYGGVTRYVSGSDYDTDLTASVYRNGTEQIFLKAIGNTTSPFISFNPSGGNVGIGNVTPVMPLQVNTLENRTNTTQKKVFSLLSTDSGFLGAGLYMAINGSTVSQAKRTADIQTALLNSDGSVNTADGTLQLQPLGGKVQIGTYTDGYATFFRRDSPSVTISNVPTGANDAIITTDAQAIDKGGALGLGGRTDSAGANGRFFAIITGRKENSVNNNQNGYMGFWINVAGTMIEWARANSTLFNINKNTTISGNLNQINGNATINMIYAEMYGKNDNGFVTIEIGSVDTYYPITNFTQGNLNGFTYSDSNLTALYDGMYKVTFTGSGSDGASGQHGFKLYVNNTGQDNCYDQIHDTTAPQGISFDCIVRINATNVVNVRVDDHNTPASNEVLYSANLNLIRIGN